MANDVVLTPMMKQFFELKAKHPDAIMLFRCGDFYETYSEDAIVASEILGITLTKRANGQAKSVEMAGFPFHALDTYLPKLVRAGKRVAICDQLEDPKMTKKLVKRGITELVTPGVAINDNVLSYKENNFLAAVHFGKASCGVAFLDISTGEFLTAEGPFDYIDKLLNNFAPKEVLFERGKRGMFEGNFGSKFFTFELDDWVFNESSSREKLLKHFETKNLKGFGVEHLKNGIVASGAILQYLNMTQHYQIGHITSLSRIEEDRYVRLDKFTVRSLELIGSMNEGGTSLLDVIDRTISPMGARLLKRWVVFPLKDEKPVNERLDVVEYFFRKPDFKEFIEEKLHLIGDLERIVSKAAVGRISPREVVQLKVALQAIEPIKNACLNADNGSLRRIGEQLNICLSIREKIAKEVKNDPPLLVNKGGAPQTGTVESLQLMQGQTSGQVGGSISDPERGYQIRFALEAEDAVQDTAGVTVTVMQGTKSESVKINSSVSQQDGGVVLSAALTGSDWQVGKAELTIRLSETEYDCCLPVSALHSDNGGDFVYSVEERNTILGLQNIVRKVYVEVVERNNELAALRNYTTGAPVVAATTKSLQEGARVRTAG